MQTLGWKVSLSNGETLYQHKGDFCIVPGELSPWQRMLKYLRDNNLSITSLSLYTDSGQTFNLPSLGKNPKFHAFHSATKPNGFNFFYKAGLDVVGQEEQDLFAVIEAQYDTHKLQIWVDCNNVQNSWSLIIET